MRKSRRGTTLLLLYRGGFALSVWCGWWSGRSAEEVVDKEELIMWLHVSRGCCCMLTDHSWREREMYKNNNIIRSWRRWMKIWRWKWRRRRTVDMLCCQSVCHCSTPRAPHWLVVLLLHYTTTIPCLDIGHLLAFGCAANKHFHYTWCGGQEQAQSPRVRGSVCTYLCFWGYKLFGAFWWCRFA